jgi:hypothetical protein
MSNIVDSLRRRQKIIVLGLALGIVSLYVLPIDQIFAQTREELLNLRFDLAETQTNNAFDRGTARVLGAVQPGFSLDQAYAIVNTLEDQRANTLAQLTELRYSIIESLPDQS